MEAAGEKTGTVLSTKEKNVETTTDCEIRTITHDPINKKALPEEVLEKIVFRLDDPDDLFAVSNSSPQFRKILEPCKSVWSIDMVFPLLYNNLEKKDILNCRLVCKGWNQTVDDFLQTHPMTRSLEPYPRQTNPRRSYTAADNKYGPQYVPTLIQKGFFGNSFLTGTSITEFMAKTGFHRRNPFLIRFVELANNLQEEPEPLFFWLNIDNLLQWFGRHIWHIHVCPRFLIIVHCYVALKKALFQLPNLKKIFISGFEGHDPDCAEDPDHQMQLVECIRYQPLPALTYLEVMQCDIPVNLLTVAVTDELMTRYASQLLKIFFRLSGWQTEKIQYGNMPKLRELQLSIDENHLACVQMLKSLNAPQLTKIYMIFQLDAEIMPILEGLKNSCHSLTYIGLWFRKKPEGSFATLTPPQFLLDGVKTLELVENQHVPYELLLSYFPNLEHILILCDSNESNLAVKKNDLEEGEQDLPQSEIRELVLSREIYKSEIWGQMKTLKEFTIATLGKGSVAEQIVAKKQFTREVYEDLK